MTNLNLNTYGVEEMNATEMRTANGGCFICAAIVILAVGYILWRRIPWGSSE